MKRLKSAISLSALLALPLAGPLAAAETTAPTLQAQTQTQTRAGYLGVDIDRVPPPMQAQLSAILPAGQGVLVRRVMKGSPADKAGLQPYDILIAYGDQKLYAPEQLSSLVRSDAPGAAVNLQLVRGGQSLPLEVVIGGLIEREAGTPYASQESPHGRLQHRFVQPQQPLKSNAENWKSFDAISLEKQPDGRYKAAIDYLASDGGKRHMEFAGSRLEIRDQILKQEDLPTLERQQLLNALSARDDIIFPAMPFNQGFFLPPMFYQRPGF